MKKNKISVYLSDDTLREFEKYRKTSKSSMIEILIKDFIQGEKKKVVGGSIG